MPRIRGHRDATLYDAVAKRVDYQGFIDPTHAIVPASPTIRPLSNTDAHSQPPSPAPSSSPSPSRSPSPTRHPSRPPSSRPADHDGHAISPEELLFRSAAAPDRFEESDMYASDRFLNPDTNPSHRLPDSDLLHAIHAYASDFFSRATEANGVNDLLSLDETALLACGILLEEAGRQVLGREGDMVLTEADDEWLFGEEYGDEEEEVIAGEPAEIEGRARKRMRFDGKDGRDGDGSGAGPDGSDVNL